MVKIELKVLPSWHCSEASVLPRFRAPSTLGYRQMLVVAAKAKQFPWHPIVVSDYFVSAHQVGAVSSTQQRPTESRLLGP